MTDETESKSWGTGSPNHIKHKSSSSSPHRANGASQHVDRASSVKSEKSAPCHNEKSHKHEGKHQTSQSPCQSKSKDRALKRARRSRSRERRSLSREKRSQSRGKRSRSREKRSPSREKRSHSKDRSRSRDRRSYSRDRSSKSKDNRSRSKEKHVIRDKKKESKNKHSKNKDRRSRSIEKRSKSRDRSRSKDRSKHKQRKNKDKRSHSKERSLSKDTRARSREGSHRKTGERSHRSRSNERRKWRERSRSREHRSHHRESPAHHHREHRRNERRSRSRSPFHAKFQNKAVLKAAAQQSITFVKFAEATKDINDMVKPSNLPLNDTLTFGSSAGAMTPQMVLQQTMAAMSAQAQSLTGVALPKYYNPAAVNPLKYAEQMQKRKLLWQGTKEKTEAAPPKTAPTHWAQSSFTHDEDGKVSAKFRKLMGLKQEQSEETPTSNEDTEVPDTMQKQEALFRDLDQQYEMARMSTHTHRGVGLGYSSQPPTLIFPK